MAKAKQQKPAILSSTFGNSEKPQLGIKIAKDSDQWGVSFQFFKQVEYFGLGERDPKWFVSLIERLTQLNSIPKSQFQTIPHYLKANRYHRIDWTGTNTPMKRSDFNWVNNDIIANEDDFPFYQFQISKSLGRVIGFWNGGHNLFHIILLDPAHNMQPSGGAYNYSVQPTSELDCEYSI
jgi:hypothetical protein